MTFFPPDPKRPGNVLDLGVFLFGVAAILGIVLLAALGRAIPGELSTVVSAIVGVFLGSLRAIPPAAGGGSDLVERRRKGGNDGP